jgi:GNAT superfamily N-acetyltransferase
VTIEIREARAEGRADAGAVTADAYREFAREDEPDWQEYLMRLADVADRASRTTILVALEDGRIPGTATLELDGRTGQEDDPLRPHEAHIRMLGVAPDARGRGISRMIMERVVGLLAWRGSRVPRRFRAVVILEATSLSQTSCRDRQLRWPFGRPRRSPG